MFCYYIHYIGPIIISWFNKKKRKKTKQNVSQNLVAIENPKTKENDKDENTFTQNEKDSNILKKEDKKYNQKVIKRLFLLGKEKIILYKMFSQICQEMDIPIFAIYKKKSFTYLFTFKRFKKDCEFVKIEKNENGFYDYFSNKEIVRVKNCDDKKYAYFVQDSDRIVDLLCKNLIRKARRDYGDFAFEFPLSIISDLSNTKIGLSLSIDNHLISHLIFSLVFCTLNKIKEYTVKSCNDLKIERFIENIFNYLNGLKRKIPSEDGLLTSELFMKYVFKVYQLREIEIDDYYTNLKDFILSDGKLSFINEMSVSSENYLHDVPSTMIEHILNSFYVLIKAL